MKSEIYNVDCLEFMRKMPDKSVDLVLTDPPYGIDMNKPFGSYSREQVFDGDWDKEIPRKEYFDEIFRVSKDQVIFGGNYFTEFLPPTSGWICWDKNNGDSTFGDGELIWHSQGGALRIKKVNWTGSSSLLEQTLGKVHPTQKPAEIMKYCILKFPEAQTIFDPFMGSGTTGVACKMLNRNFIGCEISEKYFQIAKTRIEKQTEPMDLKFQ
jgi:DNA modification methylase